MNTHTTQDVFNAIQVSIGQFANVEPEDVNMSDHLEEDLFLDVSRDLPKVIGHIMTELHIDIEADLITDFINEAEEDADKATVEELVAFVKDEVEFS
jgi:acyl carrier protein